MNDPRLSQSVSKALVALNELRVTSDRLAQHLRDAVAKADNTQDEDAFNTARNSLSYTIGILYDAKDALAALLKLCNDRSKK